MLSDAPEPFDRSESAHTRNIHYRSSRSTWIAAFMLIWSLVLGVWLAPAVVVGALLVREVRKRSLSSKGNAMPAGSVVAPEGSIIAPSSDNENRLAAHSVTLSPSQTAPPSHFR